MKEFLFSRSHKKHYSSAVVRMGKNNLGFSLVELIIVIAIMAILVAVAIPVLAVFIEKSKVANDKQKVTDILYAVNLAGQSAQYPVDLPQVSDEGLQIPVGFVILTNSGAPIILGSDGSVAASGDTFTVTPGEKGELISEMMTDVIGSNFNSEYKLQNETWSGADIPTLYADTSELFTDVKTLANVLALSGLTDYGTGEEVVAAVAQNIMDKYGTEEGREQFIYQWTHVTSDEHTFGLSAYGQETYIAVRRAYNESVAAYIESKTQAQHTAADTYAFSTGVDLSDYGIDISAYKNCDHQQNVTQDRGSHTAALETYGEVSVGDLIVSDTVYYGVFDTDSKGYGTIKEWDTFGATLYTNNGGVLADNVQTCSECKTAVTNYQKADCPEAAVDADAFYKVMKTIEAGAEQGWTTWDQYEGYVNSFANMYAGIETIQNSLDANETSYIILTVYQNEDGLLYAECNTPGVLDE